jgi:hypothetical protein
VFPCCSLPLLQKGPRLRNQLVKMISIAVCRITNQQKKDVQTPAFTLAPRVGRLQHMHHANAKDRTLGVETTAPYFQTQFSALCVRL